MLNLLSFCFTVPPISMPSVELTSGPVIIEATRMRMDSNSARRVRAKARRESSPGEPNIISPV